MTPSTSIQEYVLFFKTTTVYISVVFLSRTERSLSVPVSLSDCFFCISMTMYVYLNMSSYFNYPPMYKSADIINISLSLFELKQPFFTEMLSIHSHVDKSLWERAMQRCEGTSPLIFYLCSSI